TLRLRTEETAQRAEPVLATAVGRVGWAGSHLAFSILGPTAALLTAGLTAGLTHGVNSNDVSGQGPRILAGALVQPPAVWVLAMLALALFGLLPRMAAAVSWGALAVCWLISLLGTTLQLDQWVLDLSPFTHVPHIPGGPAQAAPLIWLLAIAVVLAVA